MCMSWPKLFAYLIEDHSARAVVPGPYLSIYLSSRVRTRDGHDSSPIGRYLSSKAAVVVCEPFCIRSRRFVVAPSCLAYVCVLYSRAWVYACVVCMCVRRKFALFRTVSKSHTPFIIVGCQGVDLLASIDPIGIDITITRVVCTEIGRTAIGR